MRSYLDFPLSGDSGTNEFESEWVHVDLNRGHLTTDGPSFDQELGSEPGMIRADEHVALSSFSSEDLTEFQPPVYGTGSGGSTPVYSYPAYKEYDDSKVYGLDGSIMGPALMHDQVDTFYNAGDQTNERLQPFYGNDVRDAVNNPEFEGGTYPDHDRTNAQKAIDAFNEREEQEPSNECQETEHSIGDQPRLPPIGLVDPSIELSGSTRPLRGREICPNCRRGFADLRSTPTFPPFAS
jgi:hypothetical protein